MQSRRLRLGDVVDDYCPRERRLSNHVIVAIVDDTIKQTRCSTCDFEHPFKDGKLPTRRAKKDSTSALFKQVLDNVTEGVPIPEAEPPAPPVRGVLRTNGAAPNGDSPGADATGAASAGPASGAPGAVGNGSASEPAMMAPRSTATPPVAPAPIPIAARDNQDEPPRDEGPVHRTLIRAQLPRIEGDVPTRPIPTFTIREAAAAPKFRRFRPKRGPGGRPFGDGFGNQGGGFKNPQFSAQPGRGPHGQKPGQPNRPNQTRPGGAPGSAPGGGGRRNNARRGNKGPR
jgi:hypothetical protein